MFLRKKPSINEHSNDSSHESDNESLSVIKYPKPSILLIDTDANVEQRLREVGFDVSEGSFGKPYRVPDKTKLYQIHWNGLLDSYFGEKDIVVIDLSWQEIQSEPSGEPIFTTERKPLIVSAPLGVIDPRPSMMQATQPTFDNILKRGGVFVIFAHTKNIPDYLAHRADDYLENPWSGTPHNNWCFLELLSTHTLETEQAIGKEISVSISNGSLASILEKYAINGRYLCTLRPSRYLADRWLTLAENKDGNAVAGVIVPTNDQKGLIFIFPHFAEKHSFLVEFLIECLPEFRPELFPYMEGHKWVDRSEYEIPSILKLKMEITKVHEDAAHKVAALEEQIRQERNSMGYLHTLITGTGDALVSAVEQALQVVGFQAVVNMDEELKKVGSNERKREDLQIRDQSPLILVEVKGVTGTSKESSALQVSKYIAPRMKALSTSKKKPTDATG